MTSETLAIDQGQQVIVFERQRGETPRRLIARMAIERHSRGVALVKVTVDDGLDVAVALNELPGQRKLFGEIDIVKPRKDGDGSTPKA